MLSVAIAIMSVCLVIVLIVAFKYSVNAASIIAIIGAISCFSILIAMGFMLPKDEVLSTTANTPKFLVDTKSKELYTEDQDGIQYLYGGEEFNLKKTISFYESSKIKQPVVEIEVIRSYGYDLFQPFKMKSEVNTYVKRVLIPLNSESKKELATTKITH